MLYQLIPLNLNSLRDMLAQVIGFDGVRRGDKLQIFTSITHVKKQEW